MLSRSRQSRSRLRPVALLAAAALPLTTLAACGGGDSSTGAGGATIVNWYINPDSTGSTNKVADMCSKQSNGQYKIAISVLPSTADGQREQIVRRLAAQDASVDMVLVDPPYNPELASAGWLRPFTGSEKEEVLKDVLKAPIASATWKGQLVGVPYSANTQLMWYRKSVADKAGVDPTKPDFTWDKMIKAAVDTNTIVSEQGKRYEGYMVWVNALVVGAGGNMITNNNKGRDATVAINSPAGKKAAEVIRMLATSKAADPALSTADEEVGRATFQGPKGGFMLNWPYAFAAAQSDVKAKSLSDSVLKDIRWARYPRVDANIPSKPPLGGGNLAVSKFSKHPKETVAAVKCLITPAMEKVRMLGLGDPVANGTVYDDKDVRAKYPMADLMRISINAAGPRPVTPYYGDLSSAVQRTWSSPSGVNPNTPAKSAKLIADVFAGKKLL